MLPCRQEFAEYLGITAAQNEKVVQRHACTSSITACYHKGRDCPVALKDTCTHAHASTWINKHMDFNAHAHMLTYTPGTGGRCVW